MQGQKHFCTNNCYFLIRIQDYGVRANMKTEALIELLLDTIQ